jgi:integrase
MKVLNDNQVRQLLISAQGHRWEALFHLAVVTGMRQMEMLGLKWSDLDWERGIIRVERQLSRDSRDGVAYVSPKTHFGKRTVILGEKTLDLLRAHFEKQQALANGAGEKWIDYGLIFTTSCGTPIDHRNLTREFKRLLSQADLPDIRFHDLRHTAASLMLNNNVAPIVVSRRLGHAKASITMDIYGHLIPGMQEEAARKMDNLVTPIPIQPSAPQPAMHTKIM